MTAPLDHHRTTFRYAIGILAILGGLGGMAGLYFVAIPDSNREPLLLALGLVLGWGATIIGYEYGSSPAGRAAADVGLRSAAENPQPGASEDGEKQVENMEVAAEAVTINPRPEKTP